jgi:hypothetical protein
MAPLWRDRPILHKPVVVTELINALTGICPPP